MATTMITSECFTWETNEAQDQLRYVDKHTRLEDVPGYADRPDLQAFVPYVDDGGPACVKLATKDADGWFDIEPGSLVIGVGRIMRFVMTAAGDKPRRYVGGRVTALTTLTTLTSIEGL